MWSQNLIIYKKYESVFSDSIAIRALNIKPLRTNKYKVVIRRIFNMNGQKNEMHKKLVDAFDDVDFQKQLNQYRYEIEIELKKFIDWLVVKLKPTQKIFHSPESRIKSKVSFEEKIKAITKLSIIKPNLTIDFCQLLQKPNKNPITKSPPSESETIEMIPILFLLI